ncbi:MAG: phosphate ABC transporter permease PstA [Chloroflexi bacterium]|nr:phosphate ABC transporter permease PstA [Chloroflexota bacterium]
MTRAWISRAFTGGTFLCTLAGVAALSVLLYQVLDEGVTRLSVDFLTTLPSRFADRAGFEPAIWGSVWVMGITALLTIPIGMGAAIYLELYAAKNWLTRFIQINIANLAGVPSIIYGILGLALFVRAMELQRSVLAGALTMALLVLPIVIIVSQEALRAVPSSLRDGALALGATRWQTIRGQILPVAMPGMLTGVILALSRAIGETAPLIMIGAFQYVPFSPGGVTDLPDCASWADGCPLKSRFTVMPVQIYSWAARPQEAFQQTAAAGIIVLLAVLLSLNSVAIVLRNRYQRKVRW